MRVPEPDDVRSPFLSARPPGAQALHPLGDQAWTLFGKIDELFTKLVKYGFKFLGKDARLVGHSLLELARHVVLADPMAIYEASEGIGMIYDVAGRQHENVAGRFKSVSEAWTGDAFEVYDDYQSVVMGHVFGDNHNNTTEFLLGTSIYLEQIADGVIKMRNQLADSVSAVLEKALEQVQHALELIEQDERGLIEEGAEAAFSLGVETGLQAATEVVDDVLGAIDIGVTVLNAVLQFQGSTTEARGHAAVGAYLGTVHKIPTTAPTGEDPPDYSDPDGWQTKGGRH